jgi:DNA-binding NtrC family response regulator
MEETKSPTARILIADDEDTFLQPTALYLQKHGYLCDCARTTEEAALALAKIHYDLLIIDINMPGNTNLEFLRDRPQFTTFLPVIIVTGYPTLRTAVESLRLSVVDYKTKPLDWPDFLESVKSAIEKARVVRVMREARQGFGTWLDQVNQMETALLSGSAESRTTGSGRGELDWYLGEAIQRFANLSVSLVNAVQTLKKGLPEGKTDVCSLMNCSRLATLERSMRDTIDVLVRTKGSFKSKELAELRKRLELVLKSEFSAKS